MRKHHDGTGRRAARARMFALDTQRYPATHTVLPPTEAKSAAVNENHHYNASHTCGGCGGAEPGIRASLLGLAVILLYN